MTRRRAFTLAEVLVALVLVATAAAALATTLGADRRLRTSAFATDAAARQLRERIESLAARCDSAETSGTTYGPWLAERWRGIPSGDAWLLTDSLRGATGRVLLAVEATVTCRP